MQLAKSINKLAVNYSTNTRYRALSNLLGQQKITKWKPCPPGVHNPCKGIKNLIGNTYKLVLVHNHL